MRYMLMMMCLGVALNAYSQALYRWQDAQGQWHFSDAANNTGQASTPVELSPSTQNIVKTPKLKTPKPPKTKATTHKKTTNTQKNTETLAQKKARCDKKRDELRFKAFRHEERNQYDHECISEMKW